MKFLFADSKSKPIVSPKTVALILLAAMALLTPLRIMGLGFLPPDDALRHAAKAISGKPWSEILVMRPEITLDSHPGWHLCLSLLANHIHLNAESLVVFSFVFFFILFTLVPALFLPNPEFWIASLLAVFFCSPMLAFRLMLGRPFIFTCAVICCLMILFEDQRQRRPTAYVAATLLIALSVWIHSLWYVYLLPLTAIGFARGLRVLARATALACAGIIIGAVLTGHPIRMLLQSLMHASQAFGSATMTRQLVYEFQPTLPEWPALFLAPVMLLAANACGMNIRTLMISPSLILFGIGFALAFFSSRFWYDVGLPAFIVWITLAMASVADRVSMPLRWRMAMAVVTAATACQAVASDLDSRWTRDLQRKFLDASSPAHAGLLPDDGGILYSDDMRLFYETFFKNPNGKWRYVLGFEPAWMTEDNLATFRAIQASESFSSFQPWVEKMTPKDRLIIRHALQGTPGIPQLKWTNPFDNLWVGKKPDTNTIPEQRDSLANHAAQEPTAARAHP